MHVSSSSSIYVIMIMTPTSVSVSAASQKRVVYGATQMVNADQFLAQLTSLGEQ